jgi:hypothetical protein
VSNCKYTTDWSAQGERWEDEAEVKKYAQMQLISICAELRLLEHLADQARTGVCDKNEPHCAFFWRLWPFILLFVAAAAQQSYWQLRSERDTVDTVIYQCS